MKRVLNTLFLLLILITVTVGTLYFIYPGVLFNAVQSVSVKNAGLQYRSVEVNGTKAHYLEGGSNNKTTLVLLHDLAENKHAFVTAIRELTGRYRVILPDLPGHGDNDSLAGPSSNTVEHNIAGQQAFVSELLQKLNANRVFIGGHGLGGHIAIEFSAANQQKVEGLILINSAGFKINQEQRYPTPPAKITLSVLQSRFQSLYLTPPAFPRPLMQHLVNQENIMLPFLREVTQQLNADSNSDFAAKIKTINVPSLILWGQENPRQDSDVANKFNAFLPNSNLVRFENAAYYPQFEVPAKVQAELLNFLNSGNP